jgi:hypothetical protein
MDLLSEIVQNLSGSEAKTFCENLKKGNYDRLDIVLFELLRERSDWAPGELKQKTNPEGTDKAYHSLRDRLKNLLIAFLEGGERDNESSIRSNIFNKIDLAERMLKRKLAPLSERLLDKAETIALENHQYDLADRIYEVQLIHLDKFEIDENTLLQKRSVNWQMHCEVREFNEHSAKMSSELKKLRVDGGMIETESAINFVFEKFKVSHSKLKNAFYMMRILYLIRAIIASAKEYLSFEPSLIRIYTKLKTFNSFGGIHASYEINFIYIIAHTLYRNLKFDVASDWLNRLGDMLSEKQLLHHPLFGKYIALRAAIASYGGLNEKGIRMLKETLEKNSAYIGIKDKLDILLNLSVYHFNSEDFKSANNYLNQIDISGKSLRILKGREWVFKKELIGVIVHYERGDSDLALMRVLGMQRKYGAFVDHDTYRCAGMFMRIVRKMIEKESYIDSQEFAEDVRALSDAWPAERKDLQAITFLCWMKSKVKKTKYYSELLEWMEREIEKVKEKPTITQMAV